MGTKRPHDSGRRGVKGQIIKVGEQTTAAAADAPIPADMVVERVDAERVVEHASRLIDPAVGSFEAGTGADDQPGVVFYPHDTNGVPMPGRSVYFDTTFDGEDDPDGTMRVYIDDNLAVSERIDPAFPSVNDRSERLAEWCVEQAADVRATVFNS